MERYSRHTVLKDIGEEGQELIGNGNVVIIGLGGLGSTMADALVRCGVGNILLVDRDVTELSNLQRQTIYTEADIGRAKTEVILERMRSINSEISLEARTLDVNSSNIEDLIREADVVLDATDNMKTRYIINDACVKYEKIWIYTAILGTYGMTLNVLPGNGPCLRCLIPHQPDPDKMKTGATEGILFTIPRLMASIATTETVKLLTGIDPRKELLTIDLWKNEFDLTHVARVRDCPCCGKHEYVHLEE